MQVAKNVISAVEERKNMLPQLPLLICFDAEEVKKQAAASTQRFTDGNPLSILDGIFMAVKDDIDCYPFPSTGSAAIVASRICPAALGSDAGGCISVAYDFNVLFYEHKLSCLLTEETRSFNVGYNKHGLPIGLQLIGRPWGEATILRLATAIEIKMKKSSKIPPASEVDFTQVKYDFQQIQAPRLAGLSLKLFATLIEAPLIGSIITGHIKRQNKMDQMLKNSVVPEPPMFKPEFPPQELEAGVVDLEEEGTPEDRVESALRCLPHYDPASNWNSKSTSSFRYWTIRDYAYAYRSGVTTPSMVGRSSFHSPCLNLLKKGRTAG
nr:fatty acid amide hydrolase-like [Tanacetum cinerariifolium]